MLETLGRVTRETGQAGLGLIQSTVFFVEYEGGFEVVVAFLVGICEFFLAAAGFGLMASTAFLVENEYWGLAEMLQLFGFAVVVT